MGGLCQQIQAAKSGSLPISLPLSSNVHGRNPNAIGSLRLRLVHGRPRYGSMDIRGYGSRPASKNEIFKRRDSMDRSCASAQSLREAHGRGITRDQIEHALKIMPFHPAMVRAVNTLKAAGKTTFLCLSNSNSVFISTILHDKKLTHVFEEVITNPASWESSGLLKLNRRVDPNGPQHSCTVGCSPNMCKGDELEAFLSRHGKDFDRIVYVGDGTNDFCPILRMRGQDLVLCRSHRGLQRRIHHEGEKNGLKPKIQYWAGGWEIEEIFANL